MYDDTKLEQAYNAWLDLNVEIGFGEHYAGDLLEDFCEFLAETKMLKRSPGRVVFGKYLGRSGFDKRKRMGLTYYSGLTLKNPPERDALEPKRHARTKESEVTAYDRRRRLKREAEYQGSDEERKARLAAFKAELEQETRERVESVGEE